MFAHSATQASQALPVPSNKHCKQKESLTSLNSTLKLSGGMPTGRIACGFQQGQVKSWESYEWRRQHDFYDFKLRSDRYNSQLTLWFYLNKLLGLEMRSIKWSRFPIKKFCRSFLTFPHCGECLHDLTLYLLMLCTKTVLLVSGNDYNILLSCAITRNGFRNKTKKCPICVTNSSYASHTTHRPQTLCYYATMIDST